MIYHGESEDWDQRRELEGTFDDLAITVKHTADDLRSHTREFDTIVCSGLSGMVVAAPVAIRLRKKLCIVRKPGDDSHSFLRVEGKSGKRWIFLDDFEVSGLTKRNVEDTMESSAHGDPNAEMIGTYYYKRREWEPVKSKLVPL